MKWLWIIAGRVFVLLMLVGVYAVIIFLFPVLLFKSIFSRLHTPLHYFHGLQPKQKKTKFVVLKEEDSLDTDSR